ncbi:MAG: dihydropteroate synthase [Planctomycetaceae bacterium]|nr:dihydropteroate synthase [Planctomycetaceae bacterium]
MSNRSNERILFITGRLAEPALRQVSDRLQERWSLDCEITVLNVTVAALMHTKLIANRLHLNEQFDRVILPGWCQGDIRELTEKFGVPFERGPKDLYDLPTYLTEAEREPPDLSRYSIDIIAEINHAPQMSWPEIEALAIRYRDSGADVIDVGCIPGESWNEVGETVRRLKDLGLRISIDSFDRAEVEQAVRAGAELVLSANSENREWLSQLDVEAVVIPDTPDDWESLEQSVEFYRSQQRPFRIDPIVEPIGCGFANSLQRYWQARQQWPDLSIMMGIGNLTELSEVDSAGVNFLLAGYCEELGIGSVLTTEVINWCRSAVAEFDLARRTIHHAVTRNVPPKHLDSSLVMLRDPKLHNLSDKEIQQLAAAIKDRNFRILAEGEQLHLMNAGGHWNGTDPFEMFDQMLAEQGSDIEASHAFYLGYEMCKAMTALTLGKQYRQDQALDWGFLTIPEVSAHERRRSEESQDE